MAGTYAAVCWHARPWWPCQHGPGGSWARTSSWPRGSRRQGQSQWSCHHRTGFAGRRPGPGPSEPCTCHRASHGAPPWRCWHGWGAGYHYTKNGQFHKFVVKCFVNPIEKTSSRVASVHSINFVQFANVLVHSRVGIQQHCEITKVSVEHFVVCCWLSLTVSFDFGDVVVVI